MKENGGKGISKWNKLVSSKIKKNAQTKNR